MDKKEDFKNNTFDEKHTEILKKSPNWKVLLSTHDINEQEYHLLLDYDKQNSIEDRLDILEEQGHIYIPLYTNILSKINHQHIIEYIVTILNQVIFVSPLLIQYINIQQIKELLKIIKL